MPRPLTLKPILDGDRFKLDIPAALSGTGRRQRLWFTSPDEAKLKASEIRARRHNLRIAADNFPELLRIDALKATQLLHSVNRDASLLDAVKVFTSPITNYEPRASHSPLYLIYT